MADTDETNVLLAQILAAIQETNQKLDELITMQLRGQYSANKTTDAWQTPIQNRGNDILDKARLPGAKAPNSSGRRDVKAMIEEARAKALQQISKTSG